MTTPRRPPEPVLYPTPTIREQDRERVFIKRLKKAEARVYARALLDWWSMAPTPRRLTAEEAHRIFLRCRRLVERRGMTELRRLGSPEASSAATGGRA